jgi:hypothetical protein
VHGWEGVVLPALGGKTSTLYNLLQLPAGYSIMLM